MAKIWLRNISNDSKFRYYLAKQHHFSFEKRDGLVHPYFSSYDNSSHGFFNVAYLFSKLAGFVGAGHDLVVEYGEVEGKSKPRRNNGEEAKWI